MKGVELLVQGSQLLHTDVGTIIEFASSKGLQILTYTSQLMHADVGCAMQQYNARIELGLLTMALSTGEHLSLPIRRSIARRFVKYEPLLQLYGGSQERFKRLQRLRWGPGAEEPRIYDDSLPLKRVENLEELRRLYGPGT